VGKGATQEFALTDLVRGAGELSAKSTDTNNVDVLLTTNSLYLSYFWKGSDPTARVTLSLTEPVTGYKAACQVELSAAPGEVAVVATGA
jgi:predicted nicotinamide N-methyase